MGQEGITFTESQAKPRRSCKKKSIDVLIERIIAVVEEYNKKSRCFEFSETGLDLKIGDLLTVQFKKKLLKNVAVIALCYDDSLAIQDDTSNINVVAAITNSNSGQGPSQQFLAYFNLDQDEGSTDCEEFIDVESLDFQPMPQSLISREDAPFSIITGRYNHSKENAKSYLHPEPHQGLMDTEELIEVEHVEPDFLERQRAMDQNLTGGRNEPLTITDGEDISIVENNGIEQFSECVNSKVHELKDGENVELDFSEHQNPIDCNLGGGVDAPFAIIGGKHVSSFEDNATEKFIEYVESKAQELKDAENIEKIDFSGNHQPLDRSLIGGTNEPFATNNGRNIPSLENDTSQRSSLEGSTYTNQSEYLENVELAPLETQLTISQSEKERTNVPFDIKCEENISVSEINTTVKMFACLNQQENEY